jgi:alkylation response protein AidB-like acyl-CoA dehydrogenase
MPLPEPPLTDVQRDIVERAARLARERFAPRAARHDAESSFPHDNYGDLHREGLLALTVPVAYGGVGADAIAYVHALRAIARGCAATALTFNMHSTVTGLIDGLGTEAQRRRYFGEIVGEGKLIASITSEPEQSFRDRYVLNTVFRRGPGGWHVAGVKQFCSLGDAADYYFLTGVVEGSASARDGIISAVVPRDTAGVKVEGVWNATGMRGTISHTIRYDCTVADDEIVGRPGEFFAVDLSGFALGYCAVYLGIGEAALDFMVEYARTRTQKPSTIPMSEHPLVQRTLGETATSLRAALLLMHETARLRTSGDREATMLAVNQAKVACTEAALRATEQAMRLAGGRGILKDLPLERWHRDALPGPVMPPANDRCLETVGKVLCGLRAATLEFQ